VDYGGHKGSDLMAEVKDAYQLSGDLDAHKVSANGSPPTWWTGER
jgi:hypothetical protein